MEKPPVQTKKMSSALMKLAVQITARALLKDRIHLLDFVSSAVARGDLK